MNEMTGLSLESGVASRVEEKMPGAVPWVGMKALMLAILEDAILCLRSPRNRVRLQAEHWIKSRENRYVFSFAMICEVLTLDPSAVRRSLMTLVSKKPALGAPRRRIRPNSRRIGSMQPTRGFGASPSKLPAHAL